MNNAYNPISDNAPYPQHDRNKFQLIVPCQELFPEPSLILKQGTIAWVRISSWACENVASDLGLGGGFPRVLRFPRLLTAG